MIIAKTPKRRPGSMLRFESGSKSGSKTGFYRKLWLDPFSAPVSQASAPVSPLDTPVSLTGSSVILQGTAVSLLLTYRIYSIKRPGRSLKFLDLASGRFFKVGRLLNFHNFHHVASLFCTHHPPPPFPLAKKQTKKKTNKNKNPEVHCSKAEFYLFMERVFKILRNVGLRESHSLSLRSTSKLSGTPLVYFSFLRGRGWVLIRGWALINFPT